MPDDDPKIPAARLTEIPVEEDNWRMSLNALGEMKSNDAKRELEKLPSKDWDWFEKAERALQDIQRTEADFSESWHSLDDDQKRERAKNVLFAGNRATRDSRRKFDEIEQLIADREKQKLQGLNKGARQNYPKSTEEEDMAAKKVVTKKGARQHKGVRKPRCKVHQEEMTFDPVEGKWNCSRPDCDIVARPKRDPNEMVLGKGKISLRIVFEKDTPNERVGVDTKARILLISDDNVALEITSMLGYKAISALVAQYLERANQLITEERDSGAARQNTAVNVMLDNVYLMNLLGGDVR